MRAGLNARRAITRPDRRSRRYNRPPGAAARPAQTTDPKETAKMMTTDPAAREAFIAGLRQLARFLASHPAAPVPKWGTSILLTTHGTDDEDRRAVDEFAAVTGAMITDEWDEDGRYLATRMFGVVEYKAVAHSEAHMAEYHARQAYAAQMPLNKLVAAGDSSEFDEAA
jgi:hypothetical protein